MATKAKGEKNPGFGKLVSIRWVGPEGTRVPPGTPGAKRMREESPDYFWRYKVGGRTERKNLGPDKEAALVIYKKLRGEEAVGNYGLTDYSKTRKLPLADLIDNYLVVVTARTRSEEHRKEVRRVLNLVVASCQGLALGDATADGITRYLTRMKASRATKSKHRVYLSGFFKWVGKKLPDNPMNDVPRFKGDHERRERRALSPDELKLLFAAAADYPVKSRLVHAGGRPRRDGSPAQPRKPVTLSPTTLATLTRMGQERRTMYVIAAFTGLRRGELSRVKVRHLDFGAMTINLPGRLTKNGRAATIPMIPQLAELIRNHVAGKGPNDTVVSVPTASNLNKFHRAAIKLAGIDYADLAGRYADFHALRMTVSTYLGRNGVDPRQRQLFLRHASASMEGKSYDGRHEMDETLEGLAGLWRYCF